MGIPTWTAGEVLTAADVNAWFVPLAACRATDSTPVLTTALASDDTLFFALTANATYTFQLFLRYSGSVTGGFKWRMTAPSGTAGIYGGAYLGAGGGAFFDGAALTDTQTVSIGTLNALYDVTVWGSFTVASTAGNLQVQVAEQATDAVHGTFLRAGSFLQAQRAG